MPQNSPKTAKKLHFAVPPFIIQLAEDDEAPDKIQLFRVGVFHHDEYGIIPITTAVLEEMLTNYRADVRGVDLAIDFSHESGKKAAGWIKDIFLNDDETELWARVAWTPVGKEAVINKEFRYTSPDFGFASQDKETLEWFGPTLNGAGLTNRPFIKRMAPVVQLSESTTEDEDMTLEEAKKTIKANEAQIKKLSDDAATMADTLKNVSSLQKTCDDAGMSPEEMMAKIKDLQDQLAAAGTQLADFKKKSTEAVVAAAEAKKASEFNILLTEGKVCEAQRASFLSGDTAAFAKLAEPVKLKSVGTGQLPVDASSIDAQKEISRLATVLLSEKKVGSLGEGIRMVLAGNKELSAKYYGETQVA